MRNFIVCDTETGGLEFGKNAITQIACLVLKGDTLEELERYSAYIYPYMPEEAYEKAALDYTNTTLEILKDKGKPAEEVALDFCRLCEKYKTGTGRAAKNQKYWPILVGHNFSGFDKRFIWFFLKKYNLDLFQYVKQHNEDTMEMIQNAFPDIQKVSLAISAEKLGITIESAHDAMADVIVTAEIFKALMKRLRGDGTISSEPTEISYKRNKKFIF